MRRWSYETFGSEQAFQFLVMATPDDIVIGAEYIKLADEVRLSEALRCPARPRAPLPAVLQVLTASACRADSSWR
jgi:hypothetical protein